MAEVIPLPTPDRYDGRTCACGSAWFDAAVTIGLDGRTTSRAHVTCRTCGTPLPPARALAAGDE